MNAVGAQDQLASPRIVVVGGGSAGLRHIAQLRGLMPRARIALLVRDKARVPAGVAGGVDAVLDELDQAVEFAPRFGIVANAAVGHVPAAMALAAAGAHLLVEKPLADRMQGVAELLEMCQRQGTRLMVGYQLRFADPVRALRSALREWDDSPPVLIRAEVGQHLADWRPGADYRLGVSAQRSLGGGALLELSHEIDLVRSLFGDIESVQASVGYSGVLDVDVDVEDSAQLLLGLRDGRSAVVMLDLLQRPPVRVLQVAGPAGRITADLRAGTVEVRGADDTVRSMHRAPADWMAAASRDLLASFLAGALDDGADGGDGAAVLDIVIAARRSADQGRRIHL